MATIQTRTRADGTTAHRVNIRRAGYKIPTATFDTDEEARLWAATMEKRIDEKLDVTGGELSLASSVRAMLTKFVAEVTPKKRGARSERYMLNVLIERFGVFNKSLAEFGPRDVDAIMQARLTGSDEYAPVASGTVRRELGMLSGAFTHAIKVWHLPVQNPCKSVMRPASPAHRTQRINADLRRAVCASLGYVEAETPVTPSQWVAWGFCFALETAMRRGELLGMDWTEYDEARRRIHIPMSKNGTARNVPISARARLLLNALGRDRTGRIIPVGESHFANVWNDAKKGTDHAHIHFHDTRHEATSQFAKVVHNVLELAAITGHKDIKMLQIYFNPESEDLADLLDRQAA